MITALLTQQTESMEGDEYFCDYYANWRKHNLQWKKTTDEGEIWVCKSCGEKVEITDEQSELSDGFGND